MKTINKILLGIILGVSLIVITTNLAGSVGIGWWNEMANVSLDLSGTDENAWMNNIGMETAYDSSRGLVYIATTGGEFGYYNISSNVTIDLSGTDFGGWIGASNINSLIYDSEHDLVYLVGAGGKFGFYNLTENISYSLGGTDVADWMGTATLNTLTYNPDNDLVYIGGLAKFGYYDITSNVSTSIGTALTISRLMYEPSSRNVIYVGTAGLNPFQRYNITNGVLTDLSATDTDNWLGANTLRGLAYDSKRDLIFLAGTASKFGYYNITSNVATTLDGTDPGNWLRGNNATSQLIYNPDDDRIYLAIGTVTTNSRGFGYYNWDENITGDLYSTDYPGDWMGTNAINTVVLDSDRDLIYMAGASGLFGFYNLNEETPHVSTCTPPLTGNWHIDCYDNCTWPMSKLIPGNITISGSGNLYLASIWYFNSTKPYIFMDGLGCNLNIYPGGGFRT